MSDRGAIESIAEALCDQLCDDDGSSQCPYDTTAQRILDRLTADGYSVVKTERHYAEGEACRCEMILAAYHGKPGSSGAAARMGVSTVCAVHGDLAEGSEDEQ